MATLDPDYEYWISRKVKISEEFNKLRIMKSEKQKKVEEEKLIHEENQKKIAELEKKIKEIKDSLNENSKQTVLNTSAPFQIFKSITSTYMRQETKEFDPSLMASELKLDEEEDNFFEWFFVLGEQTGCKEPMTIYTYPENNKFAESAQGRVLGNFAFPTGIESNVYKTKETKRRLAGIYDSELKRDGQHFVFSIKSDLDKPPAKYRERANYKKDLLYCCCVFVEELTDSINGTYIAQKRCYCLVTYFPCFDFLFNLLFYSIRQKFLAEKQVLVEATDDYSLQTALQRIMRGDYLEETKKVIMFFENRKVNSGTVEYGNRSFQIGKEFNFMDIKWFSKELFTSLKFDDFWYLLCAILQESSILFIGNNLDQLSSCVLGFHGLVRPLYWPHVLTPILPSSLFEILEAPFPLLVGIPSQANSSLRKKLSHLIIVDLNSRNPEQRIQKPLTLDNKVLLSDHNTNELKSLYRNIEEKIKRNQDIDNMAQEFLFQIKGFILKHFNQLQAAQTSFSDLGNVDKAIQILRENSIQDVEFKFKFYSTQMCINYIEDLYMHKSNRTRRSVI